MSTPTPSPVPSEPHPLLDREPLTPARFAEIERRTAELLHTAHDTVLMQAEALLPLEAAIRGAAGPSTTALNIITGPYGQTFGRWLRGCGAEVIDLEVPYDRAVRPAEVAAALEAHPTVDFVSLVHAEAATGNTNPVAELAEVVRAQGALFYLDAVASIGAEPVLVDAWDVDLCVVGPQKALGGPAGVSAVSVSPRAWRAMAENRHAPRGSFLSLLDWKERWIDGGRSAFLAAPSALETFGLEAALDRIAAQGGEEALMARHRAAAAATREGAAVLGLAPFVTAEADAAPVATTLRAPAGTDAAKLAAALPGPVPVVAGGGALASVMLRVNHYGADAELGAVRACLAGLAAALRGAGQAADEAGALAAADAAWSRVLPG